MGSQIRSQRTYGWGMMMARPFWHNISLPNQNETISKRDKNRSSGKLNRSWPKLVSMWGKHCIVCECGRCKVHSVCTFKHNMCMAGNWLAGKFTFRYAQFYLCVYSHAGFFHKHFKNDIVFIHDHACTIQLYFSPKRLPLPLLNYIKKIIFYLTCDKRVRLQSRPKISHVI